MARSRSSSARNSASDGTSHWYLLANNWALSAGSEYLATAAWRSEHKISPPRRVVAFAAKPFLQYTHLHVHLTYILMRQLADLQVKQHKALEQVVIKHQIDETVQTPPTTRWERASSTPLPYSVRLSPPPVRPQ